MNVANWFALGIFLCFAICSSGNWYLWAQKRKGKAERTSFVFAQPFLVLGVLCSLRLWWIAIILVLADPTTWFLLSVFRKEKG